MLRDYTTNLRLEFEGLQDPTLHMPEALTSAECATYLRQILTIGRIELSRSEFILRLNWSLSENPFQASSNAKVSFDSIRRIPRRRNL